MSKPWTRPQSAMILALVALRALIAVAEPPETPELKKAKAFCASADVKNFNCSLTTKEEWDAAVPDSVLAGNIVSGALWQKQLPLVLTQGGRSYWSYAIDAVSVACDGPTVARFVFKITKQDEEERNCTFVRLSPEADVNYPDNKNISVVRCELQLPEGSADNETARALRSKEGPCYICGSCSDGSGCPGNPNTWYSDTYVFTTGGCNAVNNFNEIWSPAEAQRFYRPHLVGVIINPNTEALVAKFEVCNAPPCFDAAYESKKLKDAKPCTNGVC